MYDYSKLRGRIIEYYGTQECFSKAMNLSLQSISYKLNNRVPWRQQEIDLACTRLNIKPTQIREYFFKKKVEKNLTEGE